MAHLNMKARKEKRLQEQGILGESRTVILTRWTSSIWKLLWVELLMYILCYLAISFIYRYALPPSWQRYFEHLVLFFKSKLTGMPLTFLLGFYVSLVVNRWWNQCCALPWPDTIATFLCGVKVKDEEEEKARTLRRTIIRYCVLSYVLCLRRVSILLKKKYLTIEDIVRTGLVTKNEAARIGEEDNTQQHGVSNWSLPLQWCTQLAEKDANISTSPVYGLLLLKIADFRSNLTTVLTYGHVPIPLVYSQVVHLAVYVYFATCLIGEQWLIRGKGGEVEEIDLYFPIFMTFKFLFFFGWLRVAEALYNPFGEDDDDFALRELINRHLKVGMKIVDKLEDPPQLVKDVFMGQSDPVLIANINNGFAEEIEVEAQKEEIDMGTREKELEMITISGETEPGV
eukprot:GFUD01002241.1.p1 GENE.GFUD01002241.1~~GFUD01002241.1.p1  ORF type:complete len:398 (-),score=86.32 GFUD01002241.1:145-1338(-)